MRILATIATFCFGLWMFWYGGVDLLERNPLNAYYVVVAISLAGFVYAIFPKKEVKK